MNEIFSRNIMYWGEEVQKKLQKKHGFIFGLGGVGGYTADALARAGIGELTIIDFDEVSKSNINRQLVAFNSTVNQKKTILFEQRLKDINPNIKINIYDTFYDETKNNELFKIKPDFVIDAIDTQKAKVDLLVYCYKNEIPVFSSMGAGNRIDPTQLFVADISEAKNIKCNFVKNLYYHLSQNGVEKGITCVFSKEKPLKPKTKTSNILQTNDGAIKKYSPASTPFVPPVAGYYLAYCVIDTILKSIDKKTLKI